MPPAVLIRVVCLLGLASVAPSRSGAQVRAEPAPRPAVEFALGVVTRVPGYGDPGLGPLASATVRVPVHRSSTRVLAGAAYGIVFTDGWRDPEGLRYESAPEGVIFALGVEWPLHRRQAFGVDLQWNPTVSRVRRWGPPASWPRKTSAWEPTYSTASAGLRWTVPSRRGPVVGISARLYANLHPYGLAHGALDVWPALQVTVRKR